MHDVIAFDGDDTLWHNEPIFSLTQTQFRRLMAAYLDESAVEERLLAIEMQNLRIFGYGVKGFVLSMIETAIEVSQVGRQIQVLGAISELPALLAAMRERKA